MAPLVNNYNVSPLVYLAYVPGYLVAYVPGYLVAYVPLNKRTNKQTKLVIREMKGEVRWDHG